MAQLKAIAMTADKRWWTRIRKELAYRRSSAFICGPRWFCSAIACASRSGCR